MDDFQSLSEEALYLAITIAISLKEKAMRAHGRQFTERARKQWANAHLIKSSLAIVYDSMQQARQFDPEGHEHELLQLAIPMLQQDLEDLVRGPGRPRLRRGLINSHRPSSSKRVEASEQSRGLVAFVEGMRLKSFAKREGFKSYSEVYQHVTTAPKGEIERELRRVLPDHNAVQKYLALRPASNLPRDPDKLKRKLQNARRRSKFQLPPPESGGSFQ
jgi:hypothetical protein